MSNCSHLWLVNTHADYFCIDCTGSFTSRCAMYKSDECDDYFMQVDNEHRQCEFIEGTCGPHEAFCISDTPTSSTPAEPALHSKYVTIVVMQKRNCGVGVCGMYVFGKPIES